MTTETGEFQCARVLRLPLRLETVYNARIAWITKNLYNLRGIMIFAPSLNSLTILVVDDEEPIRELLGWMLGDAGHTVHAAAEGFGALDFLREHPVDIVLSDINMPGMDGLELSRRVEAEFPNIPVLLISGRPPPSGVRAFIAKPFRWDALAKAIAMLASPTGPQMGCA